MFIREFIDKNKVKLEGSWEKYDEDFRKLIQGVTDPIKMLTILRANAKTLEQYHEAHPKEWAALKSDIYDQALGKWSTGKSDSPWAVAESQEDVDYVIKLIRNGLVVEQAGNKLYNVMGYNELFEQIAQMQKELPRTNFADTLANFIVKLEPKTPAIKSMQDAIVSDSELSTLILPPAQIKEGVDLADVYAIALHEDLKFITDLGRWTLEEAQKKLVMRAIQAGITTEELKRRYITLYEYDEKGLLGQDTSAYKAAIDLQKKFRHAKKTYGKVSPGQFTQLLYKVALEHKVPTEEIEAKVKEVFTGPKTVEREPAKSDWKIRHFTKEAQILDFAKKQQAEPNLAHLIDMCAVVLSSGSEAKWHTFMEQTYGKEFATWFIGLMHYADDSGPRQTVGQNEREIHDYLKRNAKHDAKFIQIAKENIQDIVTHAKAIGADHGAQVLSQMKEAALNEYDEEPKTFGRRKPEITIRKKQVDTDKEDAEKRQAALDALYIAQHEPEEKKNDPWKVTDTAKAHFDKIQQTGKHDLYQDRDRINNYNWTAADNEKPNVCPNCDGSGETPGRPDSRCISCHGKGIIESYDISSLSESINLVLRRLPEIHWLTAVEEAAKDDTVKQKAIISTLVKMGIIEAAVLKFERPNIKKFSKPNHLAYLSSWAKQYIDNEIELGHIKTASEAFDAEHFVHERVGLDLNIETSDDWESTMVKFDKEFAKLYKKPLGTYIDLAYKKHMSKVNEATIIDFKKPQLDKSITALKDFIDKTKITTDQEVDKLLDIVEKEEKRLGMSYDDYSSAFSKKYGMKIMPYIDAKFMQDFSNRGMKEAQVLNFPMPFGNSNPKVMRDRQSRPKPKLVVHSSDSLEFFCDKIKELIDKTDLSTGEAKDKLWKDVELGLHAIKRSEDDFFKTFHDVVGEDFDLYYLNKASEDKGVLESSESNIMFMLVEGFKGETAHRVRVELAKIIRGFVDSSDISLLSNFESYEEQDHISLKMNVYQDTVKDLSHVIDKVKEEMLDHGFTQSKGPNMFVKGNIVVKLLPIRKTFRTGPYKNRETPTWGIEVIGPKKSLKKRLEKVSEAPIADLQTIGDFDKQGSMPPADRKLLKSEKAIKKIYDVFKKTPYDFNLYFVNHTDMPIGARVNAEKTGTKFGEIDLKKVKTLDPNLYAQIIKTKGANTITLVYLYNFNYSKRDIPFTGWIIAHRLAHSLQFDGKYGVYELEDTIADKFNHIIKRGYGVENASVPLNRATGNRGDGNLDLIHKILTMKSARDQNMTNTFEFFPETFTQYLLTGSVKFNPLPTEGFIGEKNQYQELNNEMQALAQEIGHLYDALLKKCVGKAFTF